MWCPLDVGGGRGGQKTFAGIYEIWCDRWRVNTYCICPCNFESLIIFLKGVTFEAYRRRFRFSQLSKEPCILVNSVLADVYVLRVSIHRPALAEGVYVQDIAVPHDEVQGHYLVQRDAHQLVGEELASRFMECLMRP